MREGFFCLSFLMALPSVLNYFHLEDSPKPLTAAKFSLPNLTWFGHTLETLQMPLLHSGPLHQPPFHSHILSRVCLLVNSRTPPAIKIGSQGPPLMPPAQGSTVDL